LGARPVLIERLGSRTRRPRSRCPSSRTGRPNQVASLTPASWNQSPAGSSRSTTCVRRP